MPILVFGIKLSSKGSSLPSESVKVSTLEADFSSLVIRVPKTSLDRSEIFQVACTKAEVGRGDRGQYKMT